MNSPENIKLFLIGASALLAQAGSALLTLTEGSEIDRWLERGGTAVCISVLIYMLKQERDEKRSLIVKFEQIIDDNKVLQEKATESRVRLDNSIQRQTEASEKHTIAIDKLSQIIDRKIP